jgi:telomere length regulation protein
LKFLLQSRNDGAQFTRLLSSLPTFEQRNVLYAVLQIVSKEHLSAAVTTEADASWWKSDAKAVSGAAGLIKSLVANEESRKNLLISWLTGSTGAGVGEGIAIRREVVAALAHDKSDIETILEKSLQQLGDQLYIRHTPTMQQEGTTLKLRFDKYGLTMRNSSHTSCTSRCWSSPSKVSAPLFNDDKIWNPSECSFKPTRFIVTPCKISWHGSWRGIVKLG